MVQAMADRVRDLLRKDGVPADSVVKEGNPAKAIIEAAAENECDLIVLGSHGRTGLDRILMGSVSQQVVVQAKCPVMVVKAA
jgi:nucleotide-binding universal stress UspA family protein